VESGVDSASGSGSSGRTTAPSTAPGCGSAAGPSDSGVPSPPASLPMCQSFGSAAGAARVPTGWPGVDELFGSPIPRPTLPSSPRGGLPRGVLQEWFGVEDPGGERPPAAGRAPRRRWWLPPVGLFVHLVGQALHGPALRHGPADRSPRADRTDAGARALWIGRVVWPYPHALLRDGEDALLARSIFVDPPDDASRLWAIELGLRCPGVTAVVADGRGLTMAQSRRLQLAARAERGRDRGGGGGVPGPGPLVLLARPACERRELSVATLRWLVRSARSPGGPRFELELLRAKTSVLGTAMSRAPFHDPARRRTPDARRSVSGSGAEAVGRIWSLEWDGAKNRVGPFPVLVGRPDPSKAREAEPREAPARTMSFRSPGDRLAVPGFRRSGASDPPGRQPGRPADRRPAV